MKSTNTANKRARSTTDKGITTPSGVFSGTVIDNVDTQKMGRVKVNIPRFYGAIADSGDDADRYYAGVWCRIMTPIGGTHVADNDGNIMSYGIWSQAPAIGTEVMVAFTGSSDKGVVIGILTAEQKNTTLAGPVGGKSSNGKFEPVIASAHKHAESKKPPSHKQAAALVKQGLDKDALRGPSYSDPQRESPSNVFGVSTPSGHAIVMDDGDESGNSNLIRIRTAGGAQIIMDDANGFTYFVNKDGSAWIELSSAGDIDVYSKNNISMHSESDINFYAGGDINMEAAGGAFITSTGSAGLKLNASSGELNINAAKDFKIKTNANGNVLCGGAYKETAAVIHMNGPGASPAVPKSPTAQSGNKTVTSSIASRVPESEPWKGHRDKKDVSS
jgi:hypothetical protein